MVSAISLKLLVLLGGFQTKPSHAVRSLNETCEVVKNNKEF